MGLGSRTHRREQGEAPIPISEPEKTDPDLPEAPTVFRTGLRTGLKLKTLNKKMQKFFLIPNLIPKPKNTYPPPRAPWYPAGTPPAYSVLCTYIGLLQSNIKQTCCFILNLYVKLADQY